MFLKVLRLISAGCKVDNSYAKGPEFKPSWRTKHLLKHNFIVVNLLHI